MAIYDVPIGTQQVLAVKDRNDNYISVLDGVTIDESVKNKTTLNFKTIVTSKDTYEIGNHIYCRDETTPGYEIYIFVGLITDIDISLTCPGGSLIADITCIDYSIVLDNIIIAEEYEEELLYNIVADIYNKYLIDEYPGMGTMPNDYDTIKKAVFSYISISEAFDYLCAETAYNWRINTSAWINFFYRDDYTCLDMNMSNIYDIQIKKTLENYRNRQYLKGGFDTTSLITREMPTPKPDSTSKAYFTRYPLAKVPTILIDNTTVSAASVGIEGIDVDKWFYWSKGSTQINHNTAMATTLTSAQTLSITYYGMIKILIMADNVDGQTEMKENQHYSSGIYSKIEEVASIETRDEAINYANGRLYQYNQMPESISIKANCYRHVGELININYTGLTDDQLYFIESRQITYNNKTFFYDYNVLNGESLSNWTEFFRKIQLKSNDMLINEDTLLIKLQQQAEFIDVCNEYDIMRTTPLYLSDSLLLSDSLVLGGSVVQSEILYDV
jgi:hypothetical protein